MPITQMQHYMVLSKDLEKTRRFYCDVLGLRTGPRPPFDFEGLWIYVGDVAVVHVAGQASYEETGRLVERGAERHGSGSVDHIAFAANNYDELVASFQQARREVPRHAGAGQRPAPAVRVRSGRHSDRDQYPRQRLGLRQERRVIGVQREHRIAGQRGLHAPLRRQA